MTDTLWRPCSSPKDDQAFFSAPNHGNDGIFRPEVLETIEKTIDALSPELRKLSLDIHDHPELKFEEKHAHDALTAFFSAHGFSVTKNYILSTGWKATFAAPHHTESSSTRTIGVNCEMDALPGIGHACGHNLIAVAGVGLALALKAVIEKWNIAGRIIVLGTPAEEGGAGKIIMLKKGAYEGMDVCLMCHPAPGPRGSVSLSGSLAVEHIKVDYTGHTAHAALSPWEGQNALDAAVLAYSGISALRQQIRPTHRVHGIFQGQDWSPNIIPDNASMNWLVRAPAWKELEETRQRVVACFEAAALATACKVKIEGAERMLEIRQNKALGEEVEKIVKNRHGGSIDYEWGIKNASTDFGDVSYALPSLHPGFAIPTTENGGNHTPGFTEAARSKAAHDACMGIAKVLAGVGARVLEDEAFLKEVKRTFEEDKKARV